MATPSLAWRSALLEADAELLEPDAFLASRSRLLAFADLRHQRSVGHRRERLLKALEIIGADQDDRRLTVSSDDHAVLLAGDAVDDLGESRFDGGKRQSFRHDQNHSQSDRALGLLDGVDAEDRGERGLDRGERLGSRPADASQQARAGDGTDPPTDGVD